MCRRLTILILGAAALCVAPSLGYAGTLVAHWALDETSGTTAKDSTGNGFDGTVGGTPKWVAGPVGGALDLDGATNYIDVNKEVVRGTCSVALWIMPRNLPYSTGYRAILHVDQWNAGSLHGHLRAGTSLFNFDVNGGGAVTSTTVAQPDEWYHLTGTFDVSKGESKMYVNGTLEATAAGLTPALYVGPLNWGAWTDNQRFFDGIFDDIRIYGRVLSEGNVQDLANGVPPSFVKAESPNPANGTIGVAMPLLQWSKGDTAALHSLYLGTSPDLTETDLKSARSPMTLYYHIAGFQPGTTYYWRVDEIEADGVTVHTGDVWSFMTQDVTAYYPNPANEANTVSTTPTLTWMSGTGALKHHVYFGDSLDAVTQGTADADKGVVAEATFAPAALESLTAYYWRVDEILTGDVVKTGPVWSFTTTLPVDDFESYTDELGSAIFDTWIDGLTDGLSGSVVGYAQAPFAEQTIVHGGLQSMPLDYNNVVSPFYSEAQREFTTAQDWTAGGIDALVLYVRGRMINDAAPLYIVLTDSANHSGTVTSPDTAVVTAAKWTEWKIPLAEFGAAGVNLAKVKKIALGVGDKANPAAGGTGRIFVDDLCLAK